MSVDKYDSDKTFYDVIEKMAHIFNDYDEVVITILHNNKLETSDYSNLYKKLLKSINEINSVTKIITEMAHHKNEVPGLEPTVQALDEAAKSLSTILLGLKNKSENLSEYSSSTYKKDMEGFKQKQQVLKNMRLLTSKNFSSYEYSEDEYVAAEARYQDWKKNESQVTELTYNDAALHYWKYSVKDFEKYREDIIKILKTVEIKQDLDDPDIFSALLCALLALWAVKLYDNLNNDDAKRILYYLYSIVASVYKIDSEMLRDNTTTIISGLKDISQKYSKSGVYDENTIRCKATSGWIVNNIAESPSTMSVWRLSNEITKLLINE